SILSATKFYKELSMKNASKLAMSVCLSAGCACSVSAADAPPVALEAGVGRVVDVAHMYFNIATGERVVTLLGDSQTEAADAGESGVSVWASSYGGACIDQGFSTSFFYGVDDNSGSPSLATAITILDFGHIAANTVVDCVHINWVTDHD